MSGKGAMINSEATPPVHVFDDRPLDIPTTLTMPLLPFEISQQISQHLDFQSALRLMRVCKALKTAGEFRVFSVIDLTGSRGANDIIACDSLLSNDYRDRAAIVDAKITRTLSNFKRYPYRRGFVTAVRLEPSRGGVDSTRAESIIEILRLVAPHLRRLEILPLPADEADSWSEGQRLDRETSTFFALLNAATMDFPQIVYLKYAHTSGSSAVDNWMLKMPNLLELEYYSADECYCTVPGDIAIGALTVFTNLRRITFDHLDNDNLAGGSCLMAFLLLHVPNLECLRLRGSWNPSRKDKALQSLGSLARLKTMVFWDDVHSEHSGDAAVDAVESDISFNKLGKVRLVLEEAAIEIWDWDENVELEFNGLVLPHAPALLRLTLLTTPRASLSEYASLSVGLTPISTQHIHGEMLHYLSRTPLLTSVLLLYLETPFPSIRDTTFIEPEYFVSPYRWEREGHRGCICREYESPRSKDGTQVFWHILTLSRAIEQPGKQPHVGMRRIWQDATRYKDRRVPRHVLEAVYRCAGEDMAFLEGGRGLPLGKGDGAWKILEEWRNTAGDESDEEDGFVLDGTEDDDLASDEE